MIKQKHFWSFTPSVESWNRDGPQIISLLHGPWIILEGGRQHKKIHVQDHSQSSPGQMILFFYWDRKSQGKAVSAFKVGDPHQNASQRASWREECLKTAESRKPTRQKQLYKQAFPLLSYLDTKRKEKIKDGSTLILFMDAVVCHTL